MRFAAVALVALVASSLAFAPAPLPRREREKPQDDLAVMQGVWHRITHNGRQSHGDVVEIKGDVWRANVPDDSWKMKLDQRARPRRVALHHVSEPTNFFIGIYKLEGDRFTYSIRQYAKEEERPLDFAAHQPWVSVFERRQP